MIKTPDIPRGTKVRVPKGTKDLESLRKHFVEGERRYRPNGSSYCTLYLQVLEAEVSWAGTGGYWFRAPVSAVEVLDGGVN